MPRVMRRPTARIAAVLALLAVGAAAYRWWTSPTRQIHAILSGVAAALSHDEPDAGLQSLSAAAALQQHLAVDVSLETPQSRIAGRQEVIAAAARLRAARPTMRVRFFDPEIAFAGETSATVRVTAEVTTGNDSGEDVVDVHQVLATVEETNDRWVVSRACTVPDGEPAS